MLTKLRKVFLKFRSSNVREIDSTKISSIIGNSDLSIVINIC